ncbi:MAG: hypothetical protein E6G07_02160 [Actinobacteria bacterium]|nr:MAG: hypothetical protein E6G07_02160 [Actinomycetota bacterium]
MFSRLRSRLTYANVGVTIAIILAAGGLAVAAIPDSKGVIHACYKTKGGSLRVVGGTECKSGEKPLSWNQKGKQGNPGAPATNLWAVLNGDTGAIVRSKGTTGSSKDATPDGSYKITFNRNVTACSAQATIGTATAADGALNNDIDASVAYVIGQPKQINVRTTFNGSSSDQPFHLAVFC